MDFLCSRGVGYVYSFRPCFSQSARNSQSARSSNLQLNQKGSAMDNQYHIPVAMTQFASTNTTWSTNTNMQEGFASMIAHHQAQPIFDSTQYSNLQEGFAAYLKLYP